MSVNGSSGNIDEVAGNHSSTTRLGRGRRASRRSRLGQATTLRTRSVRNGQATSNEFLEQLTKSMVTSMSQLTSQLTAGLDRLHIDMNSLRSSFICALSDPKASAHTVDDSRQEDTETGQSKAARPGDREKSESATIKDSPLLQGRMGPNVVRADDWIETLPITKTQSTNVSGVSQIPVVPQQLIPSVAIEPFDGDPRNWETFIGNFKALVHDVIPSDAQKMAILLQLLCPRIRNSIATSFHSPDMYAQTLNDLRRLFGDSNVIIDTHIRSLLNIAPMKGTGKNEVERFFYDVHRAVSALRVKGAEEELRSRATLQTVASRLNRKMQYGWAKKCYKLHPLIPTLLDLDCWLEELVTINNSLEHDDIEPRDRYQRTTRSKPPKVLTSLRKDDNCPLCHDKHPFSECSAFLSLPLKRRAELIKELGRCFACIDGSHRIRDCKTGKTCNVKGCQQKHHSLLHGAPRVFERPSATSIRSGNADTHHVGVNSVSPQVDEILLAVVTADISANGKTLRVSALLDPGSEVTLIKEDVARKLELEGPKRTLRLGTFHGMDPTLYCEAVDFELLSVDRQHVFAVKGALTVPRLNVTNRKVNWTLMKHRWSHLRNIEPKEFKGTDVVLLIGMDVDEAHEQYRIVKPPKGVRAPKAVETPFGWCLIGHSPHRQKHYVPGTPGPLVVNHVARSHDEEELISIVQKSWSLDSLGIKKMDKEIFSADEKRALDILQSSTRKLDGHYECRLLWRRPDIVLPNSLPTAERRFGILENRFRRNPLFGKDYEATINEYISMGHAKEVAPYTRETRRWFLPHHGVTSPSKPGKMRVVFDASARTNGISLNDVLLPGPNLLTDLLSVLLRFRERPIAVSADIQKMFHQVRVAKEDRDVLQFLWRKPGSQEPPRHHQMLVHIFGAVCSPTVCTYALRRTAEDNRAEFPLISDRVTNSFYVDNYLDSFDTESEAISVCQKLVQLLARGGFPLTKWLSSSRRVLSTFESGQLSHTSLNLDLDPLPTEKTLGVWWNSESDSFVFRVGQLPECYTKRQVLRAVSGIYDPLGFLSPIILRARCILRSIWQTNIEWDEPLPVCMLEQWKQWCTEFKAVEHLVIPRSLTIPKALLTAQIHIFSDASELGYGCVAYLRTSYDDNGVEVRFLCSKSRVAPLKYLTIPRMELQAALIAFRLGIKIKQELTIKPTTVTYWTDSTTVLHWLISSGKRYHTFVANRIGEILEGSDPKQWKYVLSNQNPADVCSRGILTHVKSAHQRWLKGPDFLGREPNEWPRRWNDKSTKGAEVEELLPKWAGHIYCTKGPINDLISRISDVRTLRHIIAYANRFIRNCRSGSHEVTSVRLTLAEIDEAEIICVKAVQKEIFQEEIDCLCQGHPIAKKSSILTLTPFVDVVGVLRAQGRLERADLPFDVKHPAILPNKHNLSKMLIRETHLLLHHASVELTWCEVRQRYWIIKGRQAVKRVINECFYCKRLRAKPMTPLMAPLPQTRLEAYSPPFTHVGVDYAGPIVVSVGRKSEKRYICLFTCLTTRAVHLELSYSLDTDSFLMALRRFINRRGVPSTVYSDNATNFVAGCKETQKGVQLWNQEKINDEMIQRRIRWIFSPPAAPHFGGIWERMIRTAKDALLRVLNGRAVSDEVMLTALSEVESLLNARPLTHISVNPSDPEPLTPNHFLLGRAHPHIPPDIVAESEVTSKRKWRVSQAIAESFWKRWLKCYVPSLIERKKWLKHRQQLREGDIVVVVDDRSPRGFWPVGRVQECFPGRDGVVRTAKVATKFGTYTRPVTKLCLLDTSDSVSDVPS